MDSIDRELIEIVMEYVQQNGTTITIFKQITISKVCNGIEINKYS